MNSNPPISITLAQMNPVVGDVEGNARKIIEVWTAHKEQTNLIVFSELILSGYQPEDLVLHDRFLTLCREQAEHIAKETADGPAMIISAPLMNDGKRQNCALFLCCGQIKAILPKYELPNYGVFDEVRVFEQGDLPPPIDYMGHKLGIATCEDFWFPTVAQHLKNHGAEILISLNGSPFEVGKDQKRLNIIRDRVTETGLPALYVNQIGGQDEIVYDGGSFVLDDYGDLVTHLPFFEERIEQISFPLVKEQIAPPSPLPSKKEDNLELIYNCLKLGLKDYVDKNNFPGVLIGLSGGIDSALSAVIAVDALGADRVHCVMMPSPYTSDESITDAQALANNLGCHYDSLPIETVMQAYHTTLPQLSDIALENIQSRARGMMLMALSNTHGKMVLSTGNKSEMAVGYATLYGDMCGGYNVLKDVYKTQVFALSRWRNDQGHIMPDNIITRPPSAELKPDQKDEDSLPPYDRLDQILEHMIEHKHSNSDITAKGFDSGVVAHIRKLLDRAEYKRRQAPPGVKITKNSFGRERRMPITNGYRNM